MDYIKGEHMPIKPKKFCLHPNCNELVDKGYCDKHKPEVTTDKPYHHMYNNVKWKQSRMSYLKMNPLCVECKEQGRLVRADVVDHIKPHKGDYRLFWDVRNWQGLCKMHHDMKTARENGFGRNR